MQYVLLIPCDLKITRLKYKDVINQKKKKRDLVFANMTQIKV